MRLTVHQALQMVSHSGVVNPLVRFDELRDVPAHETLQEREAHLVSVDATRLYLFHADLGDS